MPPMPLLSDKDLAEIKERRDAATPGEWARSGVRSKLDYLQCDCIWVVADPLGAIIAFPIGRTDKEHTAAIRDAEFVGRSKADISALLADLEEARKALAEVMTWVNNWDPNFIYDDEWPATAARARTALGRDNG